MRYMLLTTLSVAGFALAGCQATPTAHPLPQICHQSPGAHADQGKLIGFYYDQDSHTCKRFAHEHDVSAPFQALGQCMAACYAPAPDLMPQDARQTHPKAQKVH